MRKTKKKHIYHDNLRYRMHTSSMSVNWCMNYCRELPYKTDGVEQKLQDKYKIRKHRRISTIREIYHVQRISS